MFIAEYIKVAKEKGEGWVKYMWPKPGAKEPSQKETYIYRVPGKDMITVASIYKEAEDETKQECVAKCKKAAEMINKNGLDVAIAEINKKTGKFVWKNTYVCLINLDGKLLAHPFHQVIHQKCQICGASAIGFCPKRNIYVCEEEHRYFTDSSGQRWRCPN